MTRPSAIAFVFIVTCAAACSRDRPENGRPDGVDHVIDGGAPDDLSAPPDLSTSMTVGPTSGLTVSFSAIVLHSIVDGFPGQTEAAGRVAQGGLYSELDDPTLGCLTGTQDDWRTGGTTSGTSVDIGPVELDGLTSGPVTLNFAMSSSGGAYAINGDPATLLPESEFAFDVNYGIKNLGPMGTPPFSEGLHQPPALAPTGPFIGATGTVDHTQDQLVTWTPFAGSEVFFMIANVPSGQAVLCYFDSATGSGTIPAAQLSSLSATPMGIYIAARLTSKHFDVGTIGKGVFENFEVYNGFITIQ